MEHSHRAWRYGLAALLLAALATLAACAPFGAQAPQPVSRAEIATTTAIAYATYGTGTTSATPVATLPRLSVDPGWVAAVEVANGSEFNGTTINNGTPGSETASWSEAFGYFTLSPAALVTLVFACQSPAGVRASVEVSVGDVASGTIQCAPTVATTVNRVQMPTSLVGHKLPVTVTVSTDSMPPQWNLLVEQPK